MASDILTDAELAEIRERCDKATPGPWVYDERVGCVGVYDGEKRNCLSMPSDSFIFYRHGEYVVPPGEEHGHWTVREDDAALGRFIAHSRTDVDRLTASHAALAKQAEEMRAFLVKAFEYHYLPTVEPENWVDECAYEFCDNIGMDVDRFKTLLAATAARQTDK